VTAFGDAWNCERNQHRGGEQGAGRFSQSTDHGRVK
jgi:hypothetical protein